MCKDDIFTTSELIHCSCLSVGSICLQFFVLIITVNGYNRTSFTVPLLGSDLYHVSRCVANTLKMAVLVLCCSEVSVCLCLVPGLHLSLYTKHWSVTGRQCGQ